MIRVRFSWVDICKRSVLVNAKCLHLLCLSSSESVANSLPRRLQDFLRKLQTLFFHSFEKRDYAHCFFPVSSGPSLDLRMCLAMKLCGILRSLIAHQFFRLSVSDFWPVAVRDIVCISLLERVEPAPIFEQSRINFHRDLIIKSPPSIGKPLARKGSSSNHRS